MVKLCSYQYNKSNEEQYEQYYSQYPYELHDFQKWCVEAIVTGNHVLVCCPTGSGKTFGGEFAINYFHSKGKKIIYTTPIKALSNEKYHSFTQKYPHITIGLITGDIKTNPEADVLIMTTEILLNKLYQVKSSSKPTSSSVSFDMDINNELSAVVFDEIHFISDENRGHVWEQCIMMLPEQVQMVGLSATLDNPEKFALWLETKGKVETKVTKEVYLTKKQIRSVPLIHYSFITIQNSINKAVKDKSIQEEIKKTINKPLVIQDEHGKFNDVNFQNVTKMLKLFEKNDMRVKRQFVLNKVSEYLVQHEMLPALCYVFSRKQLEICAEELTTNLLEFDSKIPYTVDRECEQIIRKLPNYEEYMHLPEYVNTVKLLRKGVGIHHAGLMPILREMIELLFAKGFVKMLFCTETMSVGINLPVKTTIFTDINKYNGEINRMLYSHEYTQAAGRAGRLGLDKVGHVIHLNNLFRNVEPIGYKNMMNGRPQSLVSKFKISYNLLLNLIDIGDTDLISFSNKSMIKEDLSKKANDILTKILKKESEISIIERYSSSEEILSEYCELQKTKNLYVNKKRKEIEKRLHEIYENNKNIDTELSIYLKIKELNDELFKLNEQYKYIAHYLESGVNTVINLLKEEEYVCDELVLSNKGKVASMIREIHCLIFASLYENKVLDTLNSVQLIGLFSCFTNISVMDDVKENFPRSDDNIVNELVSQISESYVQYQNKELSRNINTGFEYEIHYDLIKYINKWCYSETVNDCKLVLQEMSEEKGIFLGEFVKALLKINNIANEFEKIAEYTGNMEFLCKLREIPILTLKYVATNQSLYV